MVATISPTQEQIYTALGNFIVSLTGAQVVQGWANLVPAPQGGYILMAVLSRRRLATNERIYIRPEDDDDTGQVLMKESVQITIQIDCFGEQSAEWAQILSTALRDEMACDALQPLMQPLYADEPRNTPIVNESQQYEQRWIVEAHFQINPVVGLEQEFFGTVGVEVTDATTM
ncbi:MAG: hypothetical protein LBK01_09075 [Burkholderiaceae bacterium]|jgi:hypothetical protein|nr:hypothetical protein [Burkholderiaceae bacterium]